MKRLALLPLFVLALGARDLKIAIPESYVTPQATIAAYWHRMIEHRHREALDCFLDARGDGGGMLALPDLVELRCRAFEVAWRGAGIAEVRYEVEYRVAMGDSLQRFTSGDRLQLTASGWKITQPLLVAR